MRPAGRVFRCSNACVCSARSPPAPSPILAPSGSSAACPASSARRHLRPGSARSTSRPRELVRQVAASARQSLYDSVRENEEVQRKVIDVEPFVIELHRRPIAVDVASRFAHGHGRESLSISGQALQSVSLGPQLVRPRIAPLRRTRTWRCVSTQRQEGPYGEPLDSALAVGLIDPGATPLVLRLELCTVALALGAGRLSRLLRKDQVHGLSSVAGREHAPTRTRPYTRGGLYSQATRRGDCRRDERSICG